MKVAVVGGAGRWGRNIVRTLESLPDTSVAWVAGSKDAWVSWLSDPARRPAAVAIASPSYLHADHTLAALAAGLPVFVEKPLALATGDAERVRDAAAATNILVVVDHIHLFNPAWRSLKDRVGAGATDVESVAGNAGPYRNDVTPLWDWGSHDVALALDLFGAPPVRVTAAPDTDVNDRFELAFRRGQSWKARVGSRFKEQTRRVRVRFPDGEAVWDDVKEPKLAINAAAVPVAVELALTVALREFLAAVTGGPRPHSDAAFGVEVVRVLSSCGPARPN